MGITHSINPPDGKLSRKFSRQVRKDGLPQTQISEEAANANSHDNYSTKVSLPPSPISSDPIVTSIDKTIYDNSTKRVSKYILPNNEQELDRLVQIHFIYKYLFGTNFSAPVKDLLSSKQSRRNSGSSYHQWLQDSPTSPPPRVLDIACGNGTWVLEMATEFPESEFYGIDILANYPTTVKPANTFFCQCDILNPKGLPYPDNYFDYIHIRQVYSCFSEEDWVTIMKEIKRLLKPGGFIELRDIEPMLGNMGPVSNNFFAKFPFLMKKWHGVDILWARRMFDFLSEVGEMMDIHQQINALQFASPGPIGNMIQNSLRLALQSYRPFFSKHNHLPGAEYDKVIEEILEETKKYHSYFNYYCCWGRNPLYDTAYHHQDVGDECNRRYSFPSSSKSIDRRQSNTSSNMSPPLRKNNGSEEAIANSEAATNPNIFNIYPSDLYQQMVSLAEDSVSDIDQFAEGYED